jgi:membrane dipeptidase
MAMLPAQDRDVSDAEVARVHRSALLIDTHNDAPMKTVTGFDIGPRAAGGHTDLPRLREGGVGAVFFAAYVAASYAREGKAAHRVLDMIGSIRHDIAARYPESFALATSAAEIEAARRQGKIAALIGVEGGHAIENSLHILRNLYALGVRYMTLTHSNTNDWADSSGDQKNGRVKHHGGLTAFGREVVREMNRLGMLVDVSHVSDETFRDVLEVSAAPVFASHSSCRALCDVPRNMTDEMIAAMAKKGGVIHINFNCGFISQKTADAEKKERVWERWAEIEKQHAGNPAGMRAAMDRLNEAMKGLVPRATLADVVAHIDHAVRVAGVDHVGIGSDFDGIDCAPEGLDDVSKFPKLTRALLEKGYAAEDIRKIYGGNTLRLMRAVQSSAAR